MKTTCWDRVACDITDKRAGGAQWHLAAHLGDGKLISNPRCIAEVSGSMWKILQDIISRKIISGAHKSGLMSNSGISLAAPVEEGNKLLIKPVVSTRSLVPKNLIFGRTLRPHTELVFANLPVPPDLLVGRTS